MSNSGKKLERLVAHIEKTLLPENFKINVNEKIFDDGQQIAELDIEIRGTVGSTDFAWLIECRDRPSQGAAPASWIEQLNSRRDRFGFNKVTAVSTTGFAKGAVTYAETHGIELREVNALEPEYFEDWLQLQYMTSSKIISHLKHATLNISADSTDEMKSALSDVLNRSDGNSPFLKSVKTGETINFKTAFLRALNHKPDLLENLKPNDEPTSVKLSVNYVNDDDHYAVDTALGPIRIENINYIGKAWLEVTEIPVETLQYKKTTGDVISEIAAFPMKIEDTEFSFQLHRTTGTDVIEIILQKIE